MNKAYLRIQKDKGGISFIEVGWIINKVSKGTKYYRLTKVHTRGGITISSGRQPVAMTFFKAK